jgi:hypothetical protein
MRSMVIVRMWVLLKIPWCSLTDRRSASKRLSNKDQSCPQDPVNFFAWDLKRMSGSRSGLCFTSLLCHAGKSIWQLGCSESGRGMNLALGGGLNSLWPALCESWFAPRWTSDEIEDSFHVSKSYIHLTPRSSLPFLFILVVFGGLWE